VEPVPVGEPMGKLVVEPLVPPFMVEPVVVQSIVQSQHEPVVINYDNICVMMDVL